METFKIITPTCEMFDELTELWEKSVRATHHFLARADIQVLKPQIRHIYLYGVNLKAYLSVQGQAMGFVGVSDHKVEMLFVSPEARGQGVGKALLHYAMQEMQANALDVNEQNAQAIGFYLHMGFEEVGRSSLDGQGRPYPLLHMKISA